MSEVVDLDDHRPHRTLEVICVKCLFRYWAVAPAEAPLISYECKTCGPGFIISTGQWR